jgi:hypothetical protein
MTSIGLLARTTFGAGLALFQHLSFPRPCALDFLIPAAGAGSGPSRR